MSARPIAAACAALAVLGLLAGCSDEQQELRGWMEQQRRNTPVVSGAVGVTSRGRTPQG